MDIVDQQDQQNEVLNKSHLANAGKSYSPKKITSCLKCGGFNDRVSLGYAVCQGCVDELVALERESGQGQL